VVVGIVAETVVVPDTPEVVTGVPGIVSSGVTGTVSLGGGTV
jgi:hypothetical protein